MLGYPLNFIYKKSYSENAKDCANCGDVVDKKRIVTIPGYPNFSEKMGRILRRFNFRVSYNKPIVKLQSMLSKAKDPIKPEQRRGVVCKIPYNCCPLVSALKLVTT